MKTVVFLAAMALLSVLCTQPAVAECSGRLLSFTKLPALPVADADDRIMTLFDYIDILTKVFINDACEAPLQYTPGSVDLMYAWSVPRNHPAAASIQCLGAYSDWIYTFIDCEGHYYLLKGYKSITRNETALVLARLVREFSVVYSVDLSGLQAGGCDATYTIHDHEEYYLRDTVTGATRQCPDALCCAYEQDLSRTAWAQESWRDSCGLLPGYPSDTKAGGGSVTVREFKEAINRIAKYINDNSVMIED